MSSVTIWNRLEPRSRTQDLASGLAARVHDPLWLLARQWQMGEFAGRDTGSPLTAQVQWSTAVFDRYASGATTPQPYDGSQPIETLVEREAVRPSTGSADLRQAAEAGLHFLRLLDAADLTRLRAAYLSPYRLTAPAGADADTVTMASVLAGRVVDGIRLRADLAATGGRLPAAPALSTADAALVLPVATAWAAWFDALFSEPESAGSWSPDRMEYSFALGAAGDANCLVAREYDGGSVDWHVFDRGTGPLAGGTATAVKASRSLIVAPVTFRGMPARRFWEMEDAAVDISALSAGAEDLGRLLLREFALIFGNDWFHVPLAAPVGCQVSIDRLDVVDTFGVATTIPHYATADGTAGAWRMFSLGTDAAAAAPAAANLLILTPGGVGTLDGPAIEDVLLLRDEPAEMAWGVERTAVGPSGVPIDRGLLWRASQPPVTPPSASAPPKYRLGSTVPDYWIPFLPVAVNDGPLQMRRGRLPTASSGPIGRMLDYPGLTIFLEELPREGVHLDRLYRYARGVDGSTHLWIGRRRSVGKGEGRSGLRFDFLEF
jgi:hypothetical protein